MKGESVARNYDVYFNAAMHSAYMMMAAMRSDQSYAAKAARVWPELEKLLHNRTDGVPTYAEMLMVDGSRIQPSYWGPAAGASCCVWGLSMPNFLPLKDWDSVHNAVLDAIIEKPEMHFVNGICSAISAVDTWTYSEEKIMELHQRLAKETAAPGKYLPMGGAMPEKFNAPQGNLYHDIRPQGFAMGAWLAAYSSLGLRRLSHGLALRPTAAFESISDYPWKGNSLHFEFAATGKALALEIDGEVVAGSLQVPEGLLKDGSKIRLIEGASTSLMLRSTAGLQAVKATESTRTYSLTAYGLTRLTFSEAVDISGLSNEQNTAIAYKSFESDGLFHIDFEQAGGVELGISLG